MTVGPDPLRMQLSQIIDGEVDADTLIRALLWADRVEETIDHWRNETARLYRSRSKMRKSFRARIAELEELRDQ